MHQTTASRLVDVENIPDSTAWVAITHELSVWPGNFGRGLFAGAKALVGFLLKILSYVDLSDAESSGTK